MKQENLLISDTEYMREQILKSLNQRLKRSKLEIFERWVGNIALFILAPLIIIMSPLIILASKQRSNKK